MRRWRESCDYRDLCRRVGGDEQDRTVDCEPIAVGEVDGVERRANDDWSSGDADVNDSQVVMSQCVHLAGRDEHVAWRGEMCGVLQERGHIWRVWVVDIYHRYTVCCGRSSVDVRTARRTDPGYAAQGVDVPLGQRVHH